jgi:steroid delta-isomerase-like uncharacterized protein
MSRNSRRRGTGVRWMVPVSLVGAAVARELRKPAAERTWHGRLFGLVPYDFRPPTLERVKAAIWNPRDSRIFTEHALGVGWGLNLYQVREQFSHSLKGAAVRRAAPPTASLADNKALARRFAEEAWGKRNVAVVDELVAPDFIVSYPILPEVVRGREAFKQLLAQFHAALPDIRVTIEDSIAEGDQVVLRWTAQGTHQGDLLGIPATGKSVRWTGVSVYRIVDGKILEERGEEDALGLLRQLGVSPAPPQAQQPAAAA